LTLATSDSTALIESGVESVDIDINTDLCIGTGRCVLTAPKVFTQNDDGVSSLIEDADPVADEKLVHEAAAFCPVQAIKVSADSTLS